MDLTWETKALLAVINAPSPYTIHLACALHPPDGARLFGWRPPPYILHYRRNWKIIRPFGMIRKCC